MILKDNKHITVYKDNYKPINIIHGRQKIAGYKEVYYEGKHIEVEDTYNDLLKCRVQGKHSQDSKYVIKWNQHIKDELVSLDTTKNIYMFKYDNSSAISDNSSVPLNHIFYDIFTWDINDILETDYIMFYGHTTRSNNINILNNIKGTTNFRYTSNYKRSGYIVFYNSNNSRCNAPEGTIRYSSLDLTEIFGEGYEPTIEQCRKLFPCDYYPYNEGEWIPMPKGAMVNFNQIVPTDTEVSFEKVSSSTLFVNDYYVFKTYPIANHVYYTKAKYEFDSISQIKQLYFDLRDTKYTFISGTGTGYKDIESSTIIENIAFSSKEIRAILFRALTYEAGVKVKTTVNNIQFIDLTQMFGSGNEPTIEEFKALYPLDYYDYVDSRYESTIGFYEDGQIVENDLTSAYQSPCPEYPEEVIPVSNPKISISSHKQLVPITTEIPFELYGDGVVNDEVEPCVLVDGEWKCRVTRRWKVNTIKDYKWTFEENNFQFYSNAITNYLSTGTRTKVYCNILHHNEDKFAQYPVPHIRGIYTNGRIYIATNNSDFVINNPDALLIYKLNESIIELYPPINVRTLPINSVIDCDTEIKADIKVIDKN